MLAAKYRFHGYGALKFLFGHGRTYRFKSLSIRVAHNPRREHSRLAVVISKKVIKASPKRNRVRRRVYEVMRKYWQNVRPASDIVISIYDPKFLEALPADLEKELSEALHTSRLWIDDEAIK